MIPDTSPREKSALEHRPTLLYEAGATHSARTTCAAWAWVTKRTCILACLALGFAFSVVTATWRGCCPIGGLPRQYSLVTGKRFAGLGAWLS